MSFFFSSRRRHTRSLCDWSSDVCSSDLTHAGYPMDAAAVLLMEAEGLRENVAEQVEQIVHICNKHHARAVRIAANETERQLFWAGRKNAFGAVGRISPEL